MTEKLKPCPFCGGRPKIKSLNRVIKSKPWDDTDHAWFRCDPVFTIVCGKCGEMRTFGYAPMDYAVERWNIRVISNTRKSKLKPCPFCGHAPKVKHRDKGWYVKCMNSKCDFAPNTSKNFNSEAEAIAAWNRRANDE